MGYVMSDKARRKYKKAMADEQFLSEMLSVHGDKKPGFFAGEIEKHMWAAAYQGYCAAKGIQL